MPWDEEITSNGPTPSVGWDNQSAPVVSTSVGWDDGSSAAAPEKLYAPLERKTWTDAFSEIAEKLYSYLPYVNLLDVRDSFQIFADARAVEKGEATPEQDARLNQFLANQQRGSSWGYKVWNTALRMPAYALEFVSGGGLIKGGAKGVIMAGGKAEAKNLAKASLKGGIEAAAAKATSRMALKTGLRGVAADSVGMKIAEFLAKDTAESFFKAGGTWAGTRMAMGRVAGTMNKNFLPHMAKTAASQLPAALGAARTHLGHVAVEAIPRTILQPHRVVNQLLQNMTPQYALGPDDQGNLARVLMDEGDDFLPAFAKAFGDMYIENFSEQTAENMILLKGLFGPQAQKFMKAGFLAAAARQIERGIGKPRAAAMKGLLKDHFLGRASRGFIERAGWGGVIGELGEEVVGGAMRQAVGISPVGLPTLSDATAMAVGFALNPMAIGGWAHDTAINEYVKKTTDFHVAIEKIRNPKEMPDTPSRSGAQQRESVASVDALYDKVALETAQKVVVEKETAEGKFHLDARLGESGVLFVTHTEKTGTMPSGMVASAIDELRAKHPGIRAIVADGSDSFVKAVQKAYPGQVSIGTQRAYGGKQSSNIYIDLEAPTEAGSSSADFMKDPEQMNALRGHLRDYIEYQKAGEKASPIDKFFRFIVKDKIHAATGQALANQMGEGQKVNGQQLEFDRYLLDQFAKKVAPDDTDALDLLAEQYMGIRVVEPERAKQIRSSVVEEVDMQFDKDRTLKGARSSQSSIAPVLYVKRNQAVSEEEFNKLLKTTPWLVDTGRYDAARVEAFEGGVVTKENQLKHAVDGNLRMMATMLGVERIQMEEEQGRKTGGVVVLDKESLKQAVNTRIDRVNEIARSMPEGYDVALAPMIGFMDQPSAFRGQPIANIAKPVNKESGDILLTMGAHWDHQNKRLFLASGSRHTDVAEDVIEMITAPDGQVDAFVQDVAARIRAYAPNAVELRDASDREVFSKAVKVLRFGHTTNNDRDLAYFVAKHKIDFDRIEKGLGKKIDGYLEFKAKQSGISEKIFEPIKAIAGAKFTLGQEYEDPIFKVLEPLDDLVTFLNEQAPGAKLTDPMFEGEAEDDLSYEFTEERNGANYQGTIRPMLITEFEGRDPSISNRKFALRMIDLHGRQIIPHLKKFFSELYPVSMGGEGTMVLAAPAKSEKLRSGTREAEAGQPSTPEASKKVTPKKGKKKAAQGPKTPEAGMDKGEPLEVAPTPSEGFLEPSIEDQVDIDSIVDMPLSELLARAGEFAPASDADDEELYHQNDVVKTKILAEAAKMGPDVLKRFEDTYRRNPDLAVQIFKDIKRDAGEAFSNQIVFQEGYEENPLISHDSEGARTKSFAENHMEEGILNRAKKVRDTIDQHYRERDRGYELLYSWANDEKLEPEDDMLVAAVIDRIPNIERESLRHMYQSIEKIKYHYFLVKPSVRKAKKFEGTYELQVMRSNYSPGYTRNKKVIRKDRHSWTFRDVSGSSMPGIRVKSSMLNRLREAGLTDYIAVDGIKPFENAPKYQNKSGSDLNSDSMEWIQRLMFEQAKGGTYYQLVGRLGDKSQQIAVSVPLQSIENAKKFYQPMWDEASTAEQVFMVNPAKLETELDWNIALNKHTLNLKLFGSLKALTEHYRGKKMGPADFVARIAKAHTPGIHFNGKIKYFVFDDLDVLDGEGWYPTEFGKQHAENLGPLITNQDRTHFMKAFGVYLNDGGMVMMKPLLSDVTMAEGVAEAGRKNYYTEIRKFLDKLNAQEREKAAAENREAIPILAIPTSSLKLGSSGEHAIKVTKFQKAEKGSKELSFNQDLELDPSEINEMDGKDFYWTSDFNFKTGGKESDSLKQLASIALMHEAKNMAQAQWYLNRAHDRVVATLGDIETKDIIPPYLTATEEEDEAIRPSGPEGEEEAPAPKKQKSARKKPDIDDMLEFAAAQGLSKEQLAAGPHQVRFRERFAAFIAGRLSPSTNRHLLNAIHPGTSDSEKNSLIRTEGGDIIPAKVVANMDDTVYRNWFRWRDLEHLNEWLESSTNRAALYAIHPTLFHKADGSGKAGIRTWILETDPDTGELVAPGDLQIMARVPASGPAFMMLASISRRLKATNASAAAPDVDTMQAQGGDYDGDWMYFEGLFRYKDGDRAGEVILSETYRGGYLADYNQAFLHTIEAMFNMDEATYRFMKMKIKSDMFDDDIVIPARESHPVPPLNTLAGMKYYHDLNSEDKKSLSIAAATAPIMRYLDKLKVGGKGSFRINDALKWDRDPSIVDAYTQEDKLMRDSIFGNIFINLYVDDSKNNRIYFLNHNQHTVPLFYALAIGNPQIKSETELMQFVKDTSAWFGSPLIKEYVRVRRALQNPADPIHDVVSSIVKASGKRPSATELMTGEHSEADMNALNDLIKVSGDIIALQKFINLGFEKVGSLKEFKDRDEAVGLIRMNDLAFIDTNNFYPEGSPAPEVYRMQESLETYRDEIFGHHPMMSPTAEALDFGKLQDPQAEAALLNMMLVNALDNGRGLAPEAVWGQTQGIIASNPENAFIAILNPETGLLNEEYSSEFLPPDDVVNDLRTAFDQLPVKSREILYLNHAYQMMERGNDPLSTSSWGTAEKQSGPRINGGIGVYLGPAFQKRLHDLFAMEDRRLFSDRVNPVEIEAMQKYLNPATDTGKGLPKDYRAKKEQYRAKGFTARKVDDKWKWFGKQMVYVPAATRRGNADEAFSLLSTSPDLVSESMAAAQDLVRRLEERKKGSTTVLKPTEDDLGKQFFAGNDNVYLDEGETEAGVNQWYRKPPDGVAQKITIAEALDALENETPWAGWAAEQSVIRMNKSLMKTFTRVHGSLDAVAPYEPKTIQRASGVREAFSLQFADVMPFSQSIVQNVVYHRGGYGLTTFSDEQNIGTGLGGRKDGPGIYFSATQEQDEDYHTILTGRDAESQGYRAFIDIQTPKKIRAIAKHRQWIDENNHKFSQVTGDYDIQTSMPNGSTDGSIIEIVFPAYTTFSYPKGEYVSYPEEVEIEYRVNSGAQVRLLPSGDADAPFSLSFADVMPENDRDMSARINRISQAKNHDDAMRRLRAAGPPEDLIDDLLRIIDREFAEAENEEQLSLPMSLVPVYDLANEIPAYWSVGANALHGNWVLSNNKKRAWAVRGRQYADEMRRLSGGVKKIGYHYAQLPNQMWEVTDRDDPIEGGWRRVETFQTKDKAQAYAAAYNKTLPKVTEAQREASKRVRRAITAAREGTDLLIEIVQEDDGTGKMVNKRANGLNVVRTETVQDVIASTPGMTQAKFDKLLELAEKAWQHGRVGGNTEMRPVAGPEWIPDFLDRMLDPESTIHKAALSYGRDPNNIKYVNHLYKRENAETTAMSSREDTNRAETRKIPTYLDAAERAGRTPQDLDAAFLIESYFADVWGAAVNRTMISIGATSRDIDGAPLWIPVFRHEKLTEDDGEFEMDARTAMSDEQVRTLIENMRAYFTVMSPVTGIKFTDVSNRNQDPRDVVNELVTNNLSLMQAVGYVKPSRTGSNFKASIADWHVKSDVVKGKTIESHHPNINLLQMLDGRPRDWRPLRGRDWLKGVNRFNNWSKNIGLGLSLFHPVSLAESLIAMGGLTFKNVKTLSPFNWAKTVRDINNLRREAISNPQLVGRWAEVGMHVDPTNPNFEQNQIYKDLQWVKEKMPAMAPVANIWQKYNEWMNRWLWSSYFPAIKLYAAESVLTELRENFEERGVDFNESQVMREISKMMNDGFGGQNWDQYIWATPQMRQLLHLLFFAPDWTLSAFNVSGAANLPGINSMIREHQGPIQKSWQIKRYWPGMVALVMTALPQALQLTIGAMAKALPGPDDDEFEPFMFNNEPGKRGLLKAGIGGHIDMTPLLKKFGWVPVIGYKGEPTGKRRVYLRFAKQANEVFEGWATAPFTTMMNKTSTAVRVAFEQITGNNTAGWELGFKEHGLIGLFSGEDGFTDSRVAYLGRKFLPMSVVSVLDGRPSTFFAPTSRGMSQYVAESKMAEILTMYAYEDVHKKLVKKPEWEANLPALGLNILDAAQRNGYDPDRVMAGAKRYVLSKLYSDFFKYLNEGKTKKLEETSRGLMRVNATLRGLESSMKARLKTAGRELTPEIQSQIESVFGNA